MKSDIRKQTILDAAYKLSNFTGGWINLTRADVAEEAGCATGLVNKYFDTMEKLKDAVMEHAVFMRNHKIIEQGLVMGNKIAKRFKK